jgi:5-oxoprolinase (ATP-hydrolysing)
LVDPDAFTPPLRADLVDLPDDAEAFVDVAREAMAAAVRKVATARGVDLRRLALVSYGGAAGAHAADVAQRLGIHTVLVHPFASVLSAWGQTLARPSTEHLHTLWKPLEEAWPDIAKRVRSDQLPSTNHEVVEREFLLGLRPPGADHTLEIPVTSTHQVEDVRAAHQERHHEQFGFYREDGTLEAVSLRERLWGPVRDLPPLPSDPWSLDGDTVTGPARLDCPTTSIWVPSGWTARQHKGLLWLEHQAPEMVAKDCFRTRQGVALWSSRFMAVATNAGEVLRRLARSVNIRERLDFSCAVFDDQGRLVANAPHIPVHLGAMGETVRDLLQAGVPLEDGSAWLTNDPNAGGSHLPDLTVVTPVVHGDRRWFVASRGHHVDVGGTTPGSMPPHSTRLDQEGVVFRREPVVRGDQFQRLDLAARGCRQPEVVRADLEAQVAANLHAAQALRALGPAEVVQQWMTHLQDAASEAVGRAVSAWPEGHAEDILGGVPLRVSVRSQDGLLIVDFDGTGGPHVGNLNAPRAVVRAAVLYVLRVLVGDEIPLNEGALDAVDVRIPSPSILSPPPGAAVAGGNVETSQRVVDLLMRAMGLRAGAQGTMNNLTLGGEGWSLYETVGGGQGASPSGPGRSGGQVHMTNTRATDPEVLETRLPLRLVTFSVRRGSGGTGHHPGGDGVVRTLQVLAPATAALLATRRERGAAGLEGGAEGAPGRDRVHRAGGWAAWDGSPVSLSPGDRVEVSTPGGGGWRPA